MDEMNVNKEQSRNGRGTTKKELRGEWHPKMLSLLKIVYWIQSQNCIQAGLAQLVERKALNLVVMGSSPMVGVDWELCLVDLKPNSNGAKTCA